MRKLFARVTGSVTGSKRGIEQDSQGATSSSRQLRSTSANASSIEESKKNDRLSVVILIAAQDLFEALEEILCDTANLQENLSGFVKLLSTLNPASCDSSNPDVDSSVDTLISNIKHPLFAEKCNETGLATALMHALRLLRMYEIKVAKFSLSGKFGSIQRNTNSPKQGVTFEASKRLCLVFGTLMADPRNIDKIRSSTIKLLTFPLSALPEQGNCTTNLFIIYSFLTILIFSFSKTTIFHFSDIEHRYSGIRNPFTGACRIHHIEHVQSWLISSAG